MAKPIITEDGQPITGVNNTGNDIMRELNDNMISAAIESASALETVRDILQDSTSRLGESFEALNNKVKDVEISMKNMGAVQNEVLKNTRDYAKTVQEVNKAETSKHRKNASKTDEEYSTERLTGQKKRNRNLDQSYSNAEKQEFRRNKRFEEHEEDRRKKEKKERLNAIKEEAEERKKGLKNFFKGALRLASTALTYIVTVLKFGSSFSMSENKAYSMSGGEPRKQARNIRNAWAVFVEGLKDMASNSRLFKKDAEVFKSGMEIYSETLAEYLGITEMTVANSIRNLENVFKSVGLGGEFGNSKNPFAADLSESNAEVLTTLVSGILHAQGYGDAEIAESMSNISNMIQSGSGFDPYTGTTIDTDIATANLPNMFGGQFAWLDQLSDQDKTINAMVTVYDQLAGIDDLLSSGYTMEQAERNNRKLTASYKELGQKINAAKNALYSFDEVITYNGKADFGARNVDLQDRGVVISGGKKLTYDVDTNATESRDFVSYFNAYLNAAAGQDTETIKLKLIPMLMDATGMTDTEAREILDLLFEKTDIDTAKEIAWNILWSAHSGDKVWSYDQLKEIMTDDNFSINPKASFDFSESLSNLETAKAAYALAIQVSVGEINKALRDGGDESIAYINKKTAEFLSKSDAEITKTFGDIFAYIKNGIDENIKSAEDLINKLRQAQIGIPTLEDPQDLKVAKLYAEGKLTPQEASILTSSQKELISNMKYASEHGMLGYNDYIKTENVTIGGYKITDEKLWNELGIPLGKNKVINGKVNIYHAPYSDSITPINGVYASGGIMTGPTYGLVGEAGNEAVIPLQTQSGIEYLAQALNAAGAAGNTEVHVTLNGQILEMNDYNAKRLGQKLGAIIDNERNRRGSQNYVGINS